MDRDLAMIFMLGGVPWVMIGGVLLGVGIKREGFIFTSCLTSIPLCPTSDSPVTDYVGLPLSGPCSVSSSSDFNISVPLPKFRLTGDADQTAFLLHNLWSYDFTVHVCDTAGNCPAGEFSRQRDIEETQPLPICNLPDIPEGIVRFGRALVTCPLDTLATRGIAPGCATGSWPADVDWPLQQLELGPVRYSLITSETINIVFDNLTVVPMTWIDVPQMYWVSWGRGTARDLIISGSVLISIGVGFILFGLISLLLLCRS
jgi:hypothetical protein